MSNSPQFPDLAKSESDVPLPLLVAQKWGFPLTHVKTDEGYLYAIPDWIRGLTGINDVKTIWADIKRRSNLNQWLDSIQPLPYVTRDGKTHQADFADDNGLYLIAQHLRATKTRLVLAEIKRFLAQAGVFVDKARLDPEAAAAELLSVSDHNEYRRMIDEGFTHEEALEWLDVRRKQKEQRLILTSIWNIRGVKKRSDYGFLTNQIHRIALGRTATSHKRELEIKDSPRNHISAADNAAIQITEFTAGLLHTHNNSFGKTELSEDIDEVRPIIDAARPEIQQVFSRKPRRLPSGRPPQLE